MAKLKIGFIGCGGIANQKHFPGMSQQTEYVDMCAFCDLIPERAEKAAKEYGTPDAKVYTDYHELLADPTIDAVHVLTPNIAHCEITIAALEAGKHVLCEKPMAATEADAKKMLEARDRTGKMLTIGYQYRHFPVNQVAKAVVDDGWLGDIYYAEATYLRRRGVPTWGVFTDKSKQGGGPLIDIGTHALDITLWMMDNYEVESVTGSVFEKLGHMKEATVGNMFGPWDPEKYEVEDSAFGFIKMKNGATIFLESAWAINLRESREASCTLCGTKAGAEIIGGMSKAEGEYDLVFNKTDYGQLTEETLSPGGTIAFFEGSSDKPEEVECKQWLEAILNDGEPLVKPEQAFTVTKILDNIYKSAAQGKEIKFA